jgi:anaerobic nitric oxide reductase transcription regulator
MNTHDDDPWLVDLTTELPSNLRLQRLIGGLRAHFCCGAVALLRLEEGHLRPVVVDGLVSESLGRRFAVHQHPRLAAILARGEVTVFDNDSQLPDPYDGLLDTLVGEPLPVHDCMGVALRVDGRPWGVLTLDALQTGTFDAAARATLARCAVHVEAAVRVTRLEQQVHALSRASSQHLGEPADEQHLRAALDDSEILGQSEALLRLQEEVKVVADSELPVLLQGETGVGKELFARWLHRHSRAGRTSRWCTSTAQPCQRRWQRASCSVTVKGAFSGAGHRSARDVLKPPTVAPCFWMRVGELPLSDSGQAAARTAKRRNPAPGHG